MIALILNYNDYDTTVSLIMLLKQYETIQHIVVVDNNSPDNSFERLRLLESSKIVVIRNQLNNGYGGGNNFGINYIHNNYSNNRILLCNPDVIISESTIIELDKFLDSHPEYAIAAPFMLDNNGNRQYNTAYRVPRKIEYIFSIGLLSSKFVKSLYYDNIINLKDEYITVGAVAGSLFMFDVDKMIKHGMFDEKMFLYCEETVLAIKMKKANYKIALLPNESFIHNHSVSINKSYTNPISKHKILLKSKLYVIKNYYNTNWCEYLFSIILSKISIIELTLWYLIKKIIRKNDHTPSNAS